MIKEIADNYPDEPLYLTDAPEPCWYCRAAKMGVECSSVVCHDEYWRSR
jgi:hypothetical protein